MRKILLSVILAMALLPIISQDIHQSQFYTSPLNLNPALTGQFNDTAGDHRITMNYRNQWFVDDLVKYLTFTGSFDKRFYPKKWTTKGVFSAGVLINYDQAGDSKLGLTNLGLSGSYAYYLNKSNIISLGGLIGGSSRRFSLDALTWDEQYNGSSFDPNRPSGENFSNTSNFFLDVSTGLNYRWQKSRRTKMDLGFGAFHLNEPDQVFANSNHKCKLPLRTSLYALPSFKISNRFDILLHGLYNFQAPYKETVIGGYLKTYLNTKRGNELNVLLGVASRLGDALIPKIAFEYNNWYLGASYDINNSDFRKATNRRGGPEFSLMHIFVKSRVAEVRKCHIY
ncbi:MAG: PorP/SprF family type IX secretion system membrane protein [Saprospiraceae bacterium]|nr:PorP/SprF family type IX secretion system membrane protein [Saprospiraceae bacterium]